VIGQLTNLNKLRLGNNLQSTLPTEIGSLTDLETLGLTYTQLDSLPAEIGDLAYLQFLDQQEERRRDAAHK